MTENPKSARDTNNQIKESHKGAQVTNATIQSKRILKLRGIPT